MLSETNTNQFPMFYAFDGGYGATQLNGGAPEKFNHS